MDANGICMPLKTYNKKRNFKKTTEPKGKVSRTNKHLYVIQKHAASHLHYDFRLELNGVLLSWAVPKGPCLDPTVRRLAMHVEDHPVEYGHFQGIIPKGQYGGGTVMLWDIGTWQSLDDDPVKAFKKGHLHFILHGKKCRGGFNLIKFKKDDDQSWFLIKSKDKYAKKLSDYDITIKKPKSVLTHQTMEEITAAESHINLPKAKMPSCINPELATLVKAPPDGEDWWHELKFDGYRMIAFKKGKNVTLISRTQKDWTAYFSNVVKALKELPIPHLILDGEIVLLNKKQQSDFQLLQNSIENKSNAPFIYYVFDLLYYDNYNLMMLPLSERKAILNHLISDTANQPLRFSSHSVGDGKHLFATACKMGLEGIISKNADSIYLQTRTRDWLKAKCIKRQEFVIGGYTLPKGSRGYFGSLFLGVYNKQRQLQFCGNVGTGFTEKSLKDVFLQLQKHQSSTNPFVSRPPGITTAQWVKPILVAEVEFTEWTKEGILRHPSFKGLRKDKPANKIMREHEGKNHVKK